jgi:hypothetical protein
LFVVISPRRQTLLIEAIGYVFPAFLCKCESSKEEKLIQKKESRFSDSSWPSTFVAQVENAKSGQESVFIMDLKKDRVTFWNQDNQPIGFNCSLNATSYVLDLKSDCSSFEQNGEICANVKAIQSPCVHLQAWQKLETESRNFSISMTEERCVTVDAQFGPATVCLNGTANFLNYTYIETFRFGSFIRDFQAPESVFPFVPAAVCPCPKT